MGRTLKDAAQGAVLRHLGGHLSRPRFSVSLDLGNTGCSILLRCTGQALALGIRVIPEIGEQNEEDGAVHPDEVDNDWVLVVAAGQEVVLGDVQRDQDKLELGQRKAWVKNRTRGIGSKVR